MPALNRRFLSSVGVLLFAAAAAAQDAGAGRAVVVPSGLPVAARQPERLELPGLPNLAHVEGALYRGGRPQLAAGGAESLARLGIKRVINLQGGDLNAAVKSRWTDWPTLILRMEPGEAPAAINSEKSALQQVGAELVNTPLDSLDPIDDAEAQTLDRVLKLLAGATPAQPVYVHCEHGKDRTGLVLALYRVRYDGWTEAQAADEMAAMGHVGHLDELFTGNMDLRRVLARFPSLGIAPIPTVPADH